MKNIRLIFYLICLLLFPPSFANAKNHPIKIIENSIKELSIKQALLNLAKEIEQGSNINNKGDSSRYKSHNLKKSFSQLLDSYGYYKSQIYLINQQNAPILLNIIPGNRYKISNIKIAYANKSNTKIKLDELGDIGITEGDFLNVKKIFSAEKIITDYIEKNNCLLSLKVKHKAQIIHSNNDVEVTFEINAGDEAIIKEVNFKGLNKVKSDYARKLLNLQDKTCFKREYIINARSALQKTGLFASTIPSIPTTSDKNGEVPITFNVLERDKRTIKTGISYGTDLGTGGILEWEHRNFFGSGEELKSEISGNQKEKLFAIIYKKPFFIRDDQSLKISSKLQNRKLKAFDSKEVSTSVFVEKQISQNWNGGAGVKYSYSDVENISSDILNQTYSIISTPFFINNNTRDNALDSKEGYNTRLDIIPIVSMKRKAKSFFKNTLELSKYMSSDIKFNPTAAFKINIGVIYGDKARNIPVNERFYLGGSNSMRGYAYQLVGPLDKNNKPIGGDRFINTSAELRWRLTDTIGIVNFIDSGYVYNSSDTKKNQTLLHSYGIGFRYNTGFAPIRLDIGFPIKRRKSIDKSYQVYFGIGQAF